MTAYTMQSPIGPLTLAEEDGALARIWFAGQQADALPSSNAPVLLDAARQLTEYFSGTRRSFDLPLRAEGTAFRRLCWDALRTIPYGQTRSYGEMARQIGKPSASRAVGQANHHNPIPILIPCHRVIGADGSLTGFGGGMEIKQFLLALERGAAEAQMELRPERPAEFPAIYELVKAAFASAPHRDGDEQDYVNRLRTKDSYLPSLALVAQKGSALVGHIMFTTLVLRCAAGEHVTLLLSPLCVAPEHQGRGIGGALIAEGFRLARGAGYSAVFLCGDPAYYSRFGFRPAADFGIRNTNDIPPQYVLACELSPGALEGKAGTVTMV